jgi:aldose 1-epimerase
MVGLKTLAAALALAAFSGVAFASDAKVEPYGTTKDGKPVRAITLTNDKGASATIIELGATVSSIRVPDKAGKLDNVVMAFQNLAMWEQVGHANAILGRVANRLTNGFMLDGKHYDLPNPNPQGMVMHSGTFSYGRRVWTADPVKKGVPSVTLRLESPDGDGGFPGAMQIKATYTFDNNNALRMDIEATTDKPTIFNPTNHIYFNLQGSSAVPVWDHILQVNADKVMVNDPPKGPTGEIVSVTGKPTDFTKPTPIKERLALSVGPEFADQNTAPPNPPGMIRSFNITHVINDNARGIDKVAATLRDPVSGRVLTVRTTETTLQVFTPAAEREPLMTDAGKPFPRVPAIAMEAEHLPESANYPHFLPTTTLRPGQTFKSTTIWAMSVAK